MATMKVFTTYGFPLWYAEGETYLTDEVKEVPSSEWLDGQIAAGTVSAAEAADGEDEPHKPSRRRKVEA